MQTVSIRPDMVVQAPDGKAVVLVEVRNRENLTAEVASEIRRSLIERGIMYGWARFFLMASQETGYLWDQDPLSRERFRRRLSSSRWRRSSSTTFPRSK